MSLAAGLENMLEEYSGGAPPAGPAQNAISLLQGLLHAQSPSAAAHGSTLSCV